MFYTSSDLFSRIAYRKYGEGPAIMLLHGFPANGALWARVWSLITDCTVIVPDLPGTGESTGIGDALSMEQLASFVHAILEQEEIETAVLAGHSMGGYIAAAFAEKYPAMVKGISMVHSGMGADDDEKKKMREKVIELIRKGGREAFIKQMVPNLFSPVFQQENEPEVRAQVGHSLELSPEALISFYSAMMNRPDRTYLLKQAKFPMQWIMGKEDSVIPFVKAVKQCIAADINFVNLYENCGHMSMIEQPAQLAADLKRFVQYCYMP